MFTSSTDRRVSFGRSLPSTLSRFLSGGRRRRRFQRESSGTVALCYLENLEDRTLLSVTIPGTFDFFITDPGDTDIDLGTDPAGDNPPLPAGFFGAIGSDPSDPFAQAAIPLKGNPPVENFRRFPPPLVIGWVDQHGNVVGPDSRHKVNQVLVPKDTQTADTIVRRNDDAIFSSVGDAPTVDIEIVALSLVSVQPIVVTYGTSGAKLWDVIVTLDETAVQPVGSMDLTSTTFVDGVSVSGSVDNLDLPVAFKVTFREVNNPGNVREVPSTLANPAPPFGLPPAQFTNSPGTFAYPVNAVVAEKHDTLIDDVDDDGDADPGDTIRYAIGIGNYTGDDLTNLQFSDTLGDTTLVPGSINVSPLAFDDNYSTFGNITFDSAALGAPSLLNNDVEFFTDTIGGTTVVTGFDATSTQGGTVSVNANGTFTYDPPLGFSGPDTFTYDLTDSGGLTDFGTVTLDVVGPVWFIDAVNGSDTGSGAFTSPFQTSAPLTGIVSIGASGDIIFVMDDGGLGTNGPFILKDDQHLLGQGVPLEVNGGIFVPATNRPTITVTGNTGITLGSGNTVRGLNINATDGRGIDGTSFGTFTLRDVDIVTDNGSALSLGNGNLDVQGGTLTVSNIGSSGEDGVSIDLGSGNMEWQSVTGTDNAGTGIDITNSGGTFTFDSIDIDGGTTGINLDNNDNGTFRVTGTSTLTGVDEGLRLFDSAGINIDQQGQLVVSNIGSSGLDGVHIESNPGATIDLTGGIDLTTNSGGGTGLFGDNSGTITITGGSRIVDVTGGTGIDIRNSAAGASGFTFDTVTIDSGSGDDGITLDSNTGTFTFDSLDVTTSGGTGLFASGTGIVNIGDGTVNSVGNRGVDVRNTATGINLTSVSSSGSDVGINLDSITGSFTITGDGGTTNNGAGGTIQNTTGHGIRIFNAGFVSLTQLDLINIGGDAVNSQDAVDLTIRHSNANAINSNGFVSQATATGPAGQTVRWIGNDVSSQFTSFFAATDLPLLNVLADANVATPLTAGFPVHGLFVTSNSAASGACLDINNTTAVGTLGEQAIGLNQQPGGAGFDLVGFSGDGTDQTEVQNFVQSQNPLAVGVQANVGDGFGTCTFTFLLLADAPADPALPTDASVEPVVFEDGPVVGETVQELPLTEETLGAIVDAAVDIWATTGLSAAQVSLLNEVSFEIAELPGWYLGTVTGTHLKIDSDAGGHGWFVDASPAEDAEFTLESAPSGMDLLTTVLHELGHILGTEHSTGNNVMAPGLVPGVRRLPFTGQAVGAISTGTTAEYIGAPINIGTLPAGKSVTIVFDAVINILPSAQAQISNQGTVTADGGISVPTDDPSTAAPSDSTVTLVPQVDLEITKTDTADPVFVEDAFSYQVSVTNNGPSSAKGVVITDTLPAGVTWVSDDGPNAAPQAGLLLWQIGDLANGATVVWTINVTASAGAVGTTQSNTAVVSTSTNDTDGSNDAVSEDTEFIGGRIHGYKFEDLNVNGVDDSEPRLAGVEIHLHDGMNTVTVTTDANGEYWWINLLSGVYQVTETPAAGSFQTTIDPAPITIDTNNRIVMDADVSELAVGNAFEGSIHGYKFDDRNANGVWDLTEPSVANVPIIVSWMNSRGGSESRSMLTNAKGEYWFEWLRPGILYTVTERPPVGTRQSTLNPQPIMIHSGQEYVATPEQGTRVQDIIHFPWWWEVTIDPEPMGQNDPPPEVIRVEGMAGIRFSDAIDLSNPTGPPVPIIDRQNGLPVSLPDGQFQIDTEIVALSLTGVDSLGRDVLVRLDPDAPTLGQITVNAQPGEDFLTGDSFIDVNALVDIDDARKLHGFETLHTDGPVRVGMTFTDNNQHPVPQQIRRNDVRWMPVFFWAQGLGRDLLDRAGQLWDKLIDVHAVVHDEVVKPIRPVVDPDLAFGNFILIPPTLVPVPKISPTTTPTISWNDVPGAVEYQVWLARIAPSQSRVRIGESIVNTTSYMPESPLDPALYRVWVRAIDQFGSVGPWSGSQSFEVQPTLIGPVTPVFNVRPEFSWNAVPFATAYQIFLRTPTGDIVETNISETSWTPTQDLPTGPIRWWIRATDIPGNLGWSAAGETRVDGRSRILSPTGTISDTTPTIMWQSVAGASRYVLHVLNLDTGNVDIREDRLTGTSFSPSTALADGVYRAWVKAIDGTTDLFSSGVWSRPAEFTIAAVDHVQHDAPDLISLQLLTDSELVAVAREAVVTLSTDVVQQDTIRRVQPGVITTERRGERLSRNGGSAEPKDSVSTLDMMMAEPLLFASILDE